MSEWIENEGVMPVDGEKLVNIKYPDGLENNDPIRADSLEWDFVGDVSDIMEYRLA